MRTRVAFLVLPALLLAGCGGGGSGSPSSGGGVTASSKNGTAKISVVWPARNARFMPLASNSIVVNLLQNGVQKGSQIVVRPTDGSPSSATFTGLAYGAYTTALAAYPSTDGTGVAQATGSAPLTVSEDVPGNSTVSMTTTVASIAIVPLTVNKAGSATLSVGATDAQGNVVLLQAGNVSEAVAWTADKIQNSLGQMVDAVSLSSNSGASVTLTGVHSGTTQVHATVSLGGTSPLTATGSVTVNAIADGTGTVTIS